MTVGGPPGVQRGCSASFTAWFCGSGDVMDCMVCMVVVPFWSLATTPCRVSHTALSFETSRLRRPVLDFRQGVGVIAHLDLRDVVASVLHVERARDRSEKRPLIGFDLLLRLVLVHAP